MKSKQSIKRPISPSVQLASGEQLRGQSVMQPINRPDLKANKSEIHCLALPAVSHLYAFSNARPAPSFALFARRAHSIARLLIQSLSCSPNDSHLAHMWQRRSLAEFMKLFPTSKIKVRYLKSSL